MGFAKTIQPSITNIAWENPYGKALVPGTPPKTLPGAYFNLCTYCSSSILFGFSQARASLWFSTKAGYGGSAKSMHWAAEVGVFHRNPDVDC